MVTVHAASRLHFGLLNPFDGLPVRRFGGVGLMVREPGLRLTAQPAPTWSADGPGAARALAFARKFAASFSNEPIEPQRLTIEASAPEHVGLGTGTQLGLAVAQALAHAWSLSQEDIAGLAERVGRGRRSALGIHGFAQGGFLVEAGKAAEDGIAPLVARVEFPEDWRIVLIIPSDWAGLHGSAEIEAFQRLGRPGVETAPIDRLCRLVLLGMLPALMERDAQAFGEALYEFNSGVGELFAPIQGGVYAEPRIELLVQFIRQSGVRGAAQSSWGPTVAAVVEDEERARQLAERIKRQFTDNLGRIVITSGCNHGARVRSACK
jgi:beta-RFAP synthase